MKTRFIKGYSVFDFFLILLMLAVCFITLYPMWYIIANSLASSEAASLGSVSWWPSDISFDSYKVVFQNDNIVSGFIITILRTVVSTALHVMFTAMVSYAMCRRDLVGRRIYMKLGMITMFFSGGLIPSFILMNRLDLYNSFWVFVLPSMFTFYDMIIFISFFRTIPSSLLESAKVDGASEYTIFLRILLPNCKAVLATIALFAGVYHWNDYYQGVIYIRDKNLLPIQTILYKLLAESSMTAKQQQAMLALGGSTPTVSVKFASMVVATLPIVFIYPFIQKYLVKGVMIGAIKE